MFETLTLRGKADRAEIAFGYHRAAQLAAWKLRRVRHAETKAWQWMLVAKLGPQVDRFLLRRPRDLRFLAPRVGGFFSWPILTIEVGEDRLRASLGPPEY